MQDDLYFIPIAKPRRRLRAGWPLLPALVILIPLLFLPALWAFLVSLRDYDAFGRSGEFVGLQNYFADFTSPIFLRAVLNMVYFNAMFIPVTLVWSMLLASMLHRRPRGAAGIRAALFVSLFVSLTAGGIAWRSMYHPTHGMINGVLTALGLGPVDFLGQPRLALPAIVLMNVWRWFPLCVVILMAGMRRIPSEMFDLAATDGASHWQMIRHVSVPLLRRSWAICVILLVVISLRSFEEIYVMTLDGGPSTWSTTLPFLLYRTSMQCFDLGTTTTIAAILALIIGLCVFILYGIGWRQFGDRRIQ